MQKNTENHIYYAVLIDADNVSHTYARSIFEEISKYGTPTVKRIYGNWKRPTLKNWEEEIQELALTPIQQFDYKEGKNVTDIALVIDAMDILYSQNVDAFCLVSSDSDYTRLATRLKESNKYLVGMGEQKTPRAFINSCNKFIYLENILEDDNSTDSPTQSAVKKTTKKPIDKKTIRFIQKVISESISDEDDDWANLSFVANLINKQRPDFDPRNFGYKQLNKLIADLEKFCEIKKEGKLYVVRNKHQERKLSRYLK